MMRSRVRRALFDVLRFFVRISPRGKSFMINAGLRLLGARYGGVITVQGHKFWIDRIHALNRSVFFLGIYEPAMTIAMRNIVKPGMTVFDIGSNFGWYTLLLSELVGPTGRVYAFDIVPSLIQILRKNVELNHARNVVIMRMALGNKNAEVEFYDDDVSGTANLSKQLVINERRDSVSMIRFDDFVRDRRIERIDFIKCDIDGAEGLFIDGAEQTLRSNPAMMIELFDRAQRAFHSTGADLVGKLQSFGYRLQNVDRQSRELTQFDIMRYSSINVLCTRP